MIVLLLFQTDKRNYRLFTWLLTWDLALWGHYPFPRNFGTSVLFKRILCDSRVLSSTW